MQYDVQQRRSSDSMYWIVHIFILDWQIVCTAVQASVQHRIFVVYAEVASQVENRQGAGIREGADQRYFTVVSRLGLGVHVTRSNWTRYNNTGQLFVP